MKNGVAGYPQEWFPSVSATYAVLFIKSAFSDLLLVRIGDWYPERNIFQILIALTSGAPCFFFLFNCHVDLVSRHSTEQARDLPL